MNPNLIFFSIFAVGGGGGGGGARVSDFFYKESKSGIKKNLRGVCGGGGGVKGWGRG